VLGFMRALWEVDHSLATASKRMKRTLGVTGHERLVLRIVGEIPGVTPGELAELMHLDPSSLTGLLHRLVRRKLVARRPDPEDARKAHLVLTAEGAAHDRARTGTVEAAVQAALDVLAPRDVATAVVVLGAISRALDQVASTGSGHPARARRPGRRGARARATAARPL